MQMAKAAKGLAKDKKGIQNYHIKYTDIHQPDQEENERSGGIADVYMLMTIGTGAYTYFYRSKIVAWLCVYLFYCNVIN